MADSAASKLGHVAVATALITSIPALVTSIAAFRRPTDSGPAKAVYEQLAADVRHLSEQNRRNHEDMVAMRNYLDGYLRGSRMPRYHASDGDGVGDAGAASSSSPVELAPPAPPPPRLSPAPTVISPPRADVVLK